MTMMAHCCGEMWEPRSVFQGAVGKSQTFPWPRRHSAAAGSEHEFTPPAVSKSLTRSGEIVKVWYTVDGGALQGTLTAPYTVNLDPSTWAPSTDGWHSLTGWAQDRAGRLGGTTISILFKP